MFEITQKAKSLSDTAKRIAKRFFGHENALLIVVLVVLIGVVSFVTKGAAVRRANIINVILQSSTRGVAAIGQAFVILTAGIDVSVGGVGLFSARLGAAMMTPIMEHNIIGYSAPIPMAILTMLLVGAAWGTLNGSIVSRIGIPALVVTLGMWEMSKGAAFQIGAGHAITDLPQAVIFFGQGMVAGIPVPVIIFVVVAAVAYFVLSYTTFGRSIYATGGNAVSAWLSGINVKNVQFVVHTVAGFLAGVVAVIVIGKSLAATMVSVAGLELDSIAAAVVGGVSLAGGKGNVLGVVIGAIIIGIVNNAMNILGLGTGQIGIIKGTIIVVAVAVDYLRRR